MSRHLRAPAATPLTLALLLCLATARAPAQSAGPITRVEEDWELVLGTPSLVDAGPQITTTMSPTADNSRTFFAFNLNYRDAPFRPGGLQVRCFHGDQEITTPETQKTASCQATGELITWTQRLTVTSGVATFDVIAGQSSTWGPFGQGDNLRVSVTSALADAEGYDPDASVAHSGVSWQSNRVERMTLRAVRYYASGTLVRTDEAPRVVQSSPTM
jgi:hypothetical protein